MKITDKKSARKLANQRKARIACASCAISLSGSPLLGLEYMEVLTAYDACPVDARGVRGWAASHYSMRAIDIVNATDPVLTRARPEFGPHITPEKAIKQLQYCARKLRALAVGHS